jgi:hypothetical protein
MSTVIHFQCRSALHLAARSRGSGRIVMHHGTFGYCDGYAAEGDHRWIPTGGVLLDQLISVGTEEHDDGARFVPQPIPDSGPLHIAR